MEPLSVLALAGTIVNFIDFTSKLIGGSVELYKSNDGASASHKALEDVTKDLENLCDDLVSTGSNVPGGGSSDTETLQPLLKPCRMLGRELLVILKDLKVERRGQLWKSSRQAFKSALSASKIDTYKQQLDLYRSQFASRLLSLLWDKQKGLTESQLGISRGQGELKAGLDKILEDNYQLGINVRDHISELGLDIRDSLDKATRLLRPNGNRNPQLELPPELSSRVSRLYKESFSLQRSADIITSLYYPSIYEREKNVKDPHPRTYEWLFEGPDDENTPKSYSNILEWLRTGEDIFWVSGKAGCGKSTLMKYLYNHPKTRTALEAWAGWNDLATAGFFFWSAGTSMQKSQQGLLQSLLMCILKQCPAQIPHLCPDRWNAKLKLNERESWTKSELLESLARLKTKSLDSSKFCFFIDGLDEYEGEICDLLFVIKDLTISGSVKICVASRPWHVFREFLGDNGGKTITVQHLNQNDIWLFAQEQLTEKLHDHRSRVTEGELVTLVNEIVQRASGVFLWVFLVVRSLSRGITNRDTIKELRTRFDELPTELEEFFKRILDRGERVYRKQRARLFILQLKRIDSHLDAHDITHFAEEGHSFALEDDVASRHVRNVETLEENTQVRVLARCQDLLEFCEKGTLQFLHRTVKDFLESDHIFDELTERAGEDFNPHRFLCNSMVVQIKAIIQRLEPSERNTKDSLEDYYAQHLLKDFNPVSKILACFWCHTRMLAKGDQLSFELLAALDEASYSLHIIYEKWGSRYLSKFDQSEAVFFHRDHCYEGWFADQIVNEGASQILFLLIGKTMQPVLRDGAPQRTLLEMAVTHMRSEQRSATIESLLQRGANPNETVWKVFLDQLKIILERDYQQLRILNAFLEHGADRSLLFDISSITYGILSELASNVSFTTERLWAPTELHALRSLLAKWPTLPIRPKRALENVEEEKETIKRRKDYPSTISED